jgi:ribosomal protein S17
VVVKPQKTIVVTFKRVINIRNIKTLVKQNVYMAHDELKMQAKLEISSFRKEFTL